MSIKLYTKDFSKTFENIGIFPLINLEVTSAFVFPLTTIDFTLLHSSSSKSIMVFIFLFLNASPNFVLISLVIFLCFLIFPLFLTSSLFGLFIEFIFADLNGSSCFTFAVIENHVQSAVLIHHYLQNSKIYYQKDCNIFLCNLSHLSRQ